MKNKQVKQMICGALDKKHGLKYPLSHFFMDSYGLCELYISGWGPDNYEQAYDYVMLGVVSLTANQLKGK